MTEALGEGEVIVSIRSIAVGGAGVGDVRAAGLGGEGLEGIRAFVPFTCPGDEVVAKVTVRKERFIETEVVRISRPSPSRVTPACPYYGSCGGCELQHIDYGAQREGKHDMVRGALRAAKLPPFVQDLTEPIVPSRPYGYRRRVTLHIDGAGRVGYYQRRTRDVIPVHQCPISVESINDRLTHLQDLPPLQLREAEGTLVVEAGEMGVSATLKLPKVAAAYDVHALLELFRDTFPSLLIVAAGKPVASIGSRTIPLRLGGRVVEVPAGSFSQVNWGINEALVAHVVMTAMAESTGVAHDLYAGAGNFAIPLASRGVRVTAVEAGGDLVAVGAAQALSLGLSNLLRFEGGSVERFLRKNPDPRGVDLVVADPPRSGLGPLAERLGYAPRLILVSCHLPSFVRDLGALMRSGWRPERITPFDMFAQTSYLEIVTELRR
jgi:23S rRNA (uracil1939-C5)-methyltransferase